MMSGLKLFLIASSLISPRKCAEFADAVTAGLAVQGQTGIITVDTSILTADEENFLITYGYISPPAETLMLPTSTVESLGITWGPWNQTVSEDAVVLETLDNGLVRIVSGDYFAELTPTPVANLNGTHNYQSTAASSFIGHGNAGDIEQLVAAMRVNFDTGLISEGKLQILVGDQNWSVDFDGLVQSGAVSLNPLSGQLFIDTELLSNSIDANLGGAFTGPNGEAFVGGFDLIDELNPVNEVNGLFTIER